MDKNLFVACCGADGSFAHEATRRMLKDAAILHFKDFQSVGRAVAGGFCPYGVLPVENTLVGPVPEVCDILRRRHFRIARSTRVPVDLYLLGLPGARLDDIREIVSYPLAVDQCKGFLRAHPEIRAVRAENTALAAKEVVASNRRDRAAIASRLCAKLYGLDILAGPIQDAVFNMTRFVCIEPKERLGTIEAATKHVDFRLQNHG